MKKALVALMIVATALVAQANVWNVNWSITAALAPDDTAGDMSISLFENYDITWDLINASAGDTVIKTASMVNGTIQWDDRENGGNLATFSDWLIPAGEGKTRYMGSTDANTAQTIYQKITLVSKTTGDEYVWEGEHFTFTPNDKTTDAPLDLDISTVVAAQGVSFEGATMASWTKVSAVPEPATMSLLGLGALAMILRRRIRR